MATKGSSRRGSGRETAGSQTRGKPTAASQKDSGNTRRHVYLDTFNTAEFCAKDKNKIADKCKDQPASEKQKKANDKAKRKKHLLGGLKDRVGDAVKGMDALGKVGYIKDGGNAWMDDHCDGMWVKPWHTSLDAFKHYVGQIKKEMEANIWQVAKDAAGTVGEMAKDGAIELGKSTLEKQAIGGAAALSSAWFPPLAGAIEAGTQAWSIAGALNSTGTFLGQGAGAIAIGQEKFEQIEDQIKKLEGMLDPNLKSTEVWEEAMTAMAAANACMRARKCQLVPYSATEYPASLKGDGCCPGQSGHHVIPDAAANSCPGYKNGEAPTICLEGTSNTHGSHGAAHQALKIKTAKYNKGEAPQPIGFADMQKMALDSLGPSIAGCSRTCLIAQLKSYYGDCTSMVADPGTGGKKPKPPVQMPTPTPTRK